MEVNAFWVDNIELYCDDGNAGISPVQLLESLLFCFDCQHNQGCQLLEVYLKDVGFIVCVWFTVLVITLSLSNGLFALRGST